MKRFGLLFLVALLPACEKKKSAPDAPVASARIDAAPEAAPPPPRTGPSPSRIVGISPKTLVYAWHDTIATIDVAP